MLDIFEFIIYSKYTFSEIQIGGTNMILIFEVEKVLDAHEYNGKMLYPFTIKNLQNKGTNRPQIINATVEIPKDCKQVSCELYYYKSNDDKKAVPKLVKFQPYLK